jgi:hypothetical protein
VLHKPQVVISQPSRLTAAVLAAGDDKRASMYT